MTLQEILMNAEQELQKAGIVEYKSDAWILFSECFKLSRVDYMMQCIEYREENERTQEEYQHFLQMLEKRKKGIPVQYITHNQNFYGYDYYVDERVLIPRQDTEVLVETIEQLMQQRMLEKKEINCGSLLDVCTGSGCIAITLANMLEWNEVCAIDISKEALMVAEKNNQTYGGKVTFIESDVFAELDRLKTFDVIVSNPPYIESAVIETLSREVKDHEPRLALDGTEDGLFFYRKIIKEAKQYLKKEGLLAFEIGYNQAEAVKQLFYANEYKDVRIVADLAGLDRVALGWLK